MTFHAFKPEAPGAKYCACGLHEADMEHGAPSEQTTPTLPDIASQQLLNRIEAILTRAGSFAQCKGCFDGIYWITETTTRRKVAYNRDGSIHFDNCKRQHEFGKQEGR